GQDVMAIGSPGGYGFAVGVGIVAWYGRDSAMLSPDDFMLVTASIIGGNSGGVVVNTRGEAVSLVSYGYGIYTQTVPIDRAQTVAAEIERRAELIGRCKAQAVGAACG
ncbi:S1C family serine protease, partial [Klebsiella pneumoniae]